MTHRKPLSRTDRLRCFTTAEGMCHICGQLIKVGEPWDVSHPIPLEMGGPDDDTNRKPAHRACHREHTSKVDAPMIAKAKRIHAKHIGARKPSRFPGSKDSPFKKKVDGTVVPR